MTAPSRVPGSIRKTKTGRVVSDRMDKTIVVSVERLARHPLYKRVIRLTTKFKAHDDANEAHVGDTVLIEESRPLSATKRWRLVRVVARAGDHGTAAEIAVEEDAVSEAIHGAAHPGRVRAEAAEAGEAAGREVAAEAAEPEAAEPEPAPEEASKADQGPAEAAAEPEAAGAGETSA
jgi:small subunit ribosomal protein S17